ncbi:MAG: heme-binding domain-containing protein [Sphingobacteriales bacterium]|nr:heme-binding domain-containing protein [Sphingobacteriales bacterium]
MLKKIMLVILAILVIIQFIHPKKNQAEGPQANYIGNNYAVSAEVKSILEKACNDCHSNNTRYPWYAKIQPVHWWLDKHVKDGKKEVNFDEYSNRPPRYQYKKMKEVIEQVKEGEMPLNSYTWTHTDAKLTSSEKEALTGWAQAVLNDLKSRYPIDSLEIKKN